MASPTTTTKPANKISSDLARVLLIEVTNKSKLSQAFRGKICMDARVLPAQMAYANHCGT